MVKKNIVNLIVRLDESADVVHVNKETLVIGSHGSTVVLAPWHTTLDLWKAIRGAYNRPVWQALKHVVRSVSHRGATIQSGWSGKPLNFIADGDILEVEIEEAFDYQTICKIM